MVNQCKDCYKMQAISKNYVHSHYWLKYLVTYSLFNCSEILGNINIVCPFKCLGGGGDTPHNGLYREALPERDTFFGLEVYKRVGIPQAEA